MSGDAASLFASRLESLVAEHERKARSLLIDFGDELPQEVRGFLDDVSVIRQDVQRETYSDWGRVS